MYLHNWEFLHEFQEPFLLPLKARTFFPSEGEIQREARRPNRHHSLAATCMTARRTFQRLWWGWIATYPVLSSWQPSERFPPQTIFDLWSGSVDWPHVWPVKNTWAVLHFGWREEWRGTSVSSCVCQGFAAVWMSFCKLCIPLTWAHALSYGGKGWTSERTFAGNPFVFILFVILILVFSLLLLFGCRKSRSKNKRNN